MFEEFVMDPADRGASGSWPASACFLAAVLMAVTVTTSFAASPVIGTAMVDGTFVLDASTIRGNGTLFEGSTLATAKAASQLRLSNGVRVLLADHSRAKVFRDHLLLQAGGGQLEAASGYRIRAGAIDVIPSANGVTKVAFAAANRIAVEAVAGAVEIRRAGGLLLAKLDAGKALELDPSAAGASAPSTLTGVVEFKNGHYLLRDETAGITVELKGADLAKEVGNLVEVTGVIDPTATPAQGASQVIRVTQFKHVSKGKTKKGMTGGQKAVVAGVVIAGASTGLAIGLTGEEKQPISQ